MAMLMHPIETQIVSPCGRFRYYLERRWADGPLDLYVMTNPSEAGTTKREDPTTKKCRGFSERHGAGGFAIINERAMVASDPREVASAIRAGRDPRGPDNAEHVLAALRSQARTGGRVIFAWGQGAMAADTRPLRAAIDAWARALGIVPLCLGTTLEGHPRHPLMLGYATRAVPWDPR